MEFTCGGAKLSWRRSRAGAALGFCGGCGWEDEGGAGLRGQLKGAPGILGVRAVEGAVRSSARRSGSIGAAEGKGESDEAARWAGLSAGDARGRRGAERVSECAGASGSERLGRARVGAGVREAGERATGSLHGAGPC